jgi:hypothetical protein
MSDLVPVPADVASRAHVDTDAYRSMYDASVSDPEAF